VAVDDLAAEFFVIENRLELCDIMAQTPQEMNAAFA
jgi:hypothetical protein